MYPKNFISAEIVSRQEVNGSNGSNFYRASGLCLSAYRWHSPGNLWVTEFTFNRIRRTIILLLECLLVCVQWNCNVNLRRHSDRWFKKRYYSCLGYSADNCGTHRRWTRRFAGFTRRNNWVDCSFNPSNIMNLRKNFRFPIFFQRKIFLQGGAKRRADTGKMVTANL